jgi:hypothetical protein
MLCTAIVASPTLPTLRSIGSIEGRAHHLSQSRRGVAAPRGRHPSSLHPHHRHDEPPCVTHHRGRRARVEVENAAAIALYERAGFVVLGETPRNVAFTGARGARARSLRPTERNITLH